MTKLVVSIFILVAIVFLIAFTAQRKCGKIKTEYLIVSSVYHNTDSFVSSEYWSGLAIDKSGKKIQYEVFHPTEVGGVIKYKHNQCGNEGFIN